MPKDLFSEESPMKLFGSKVKEPPVKEPPAKLGTDAPRVLAMPVASKMPAPSTKEHSTMSDDIKEQMLAILGEVNELREHEAALMEEKEGHRDQAKKSEEEYLRCEGEIKELREQEISLKAKMAEINGQLFFREEEKEVIEKDNAH